ncbi:MAG: hypothetical protein NDJ92_14695, partial [Thermoanaerobaculia bacterium]|nr:hypothetical protein [Thermoanaerobaculia bacterium]
DGTSSRAISNWQFHHTKGDIFNEELSRSAFEIENRFNLSLTYDFRTGPLSHSVGLFYNAQSGRPYSIMMAGDPNRDGYTSNDLLYVPSNGLILCPSNANGSPNASAPCRTSTGTTVAPLDPAKFAAFLSSVGVDPNSGRILDRYEQNEPWTRQFDLSYQLGLPEIVGVGTQLTFDVVNVANMIDEEEGVVEYVSNQNYTAVAWQGMDPATGLPVYRENFNGSTNPGAQFSTADNRSRWQARVGVRLNF